MRERAKDLTPNTEFEAPPLRQEIAERGPDIAAPLPAARAPVLDLPPRLPENDLERIKRRTLLADNPETVLTSLIDECHFLMSEVAYRCIVQSPNVEDRLVLMKSAMSFAETGAKVAKALAALRSAPIDPDRRTEMLVQADRWMEAKKERESEKQ